MIYLIDGHNLIGQLPDIDLADPNDEEKLVRKLQGWVAAGGNRRVVVYFDPGEQGGWGDMLGGGQVKVKFARLGQIADALIIKKVREVRNPQEFTVVTSDRAILAEVRKRRMGYILSNEFATLLNEYLKEIRPAETDPDENDAGAEAEVTLSDQEVDAWLSIFEKAPKPKRSARPSGVKKPPSTPVKKPVQNPPSASEFKEGMGGLNEKEVAEWLELFGGEPEKKGPAKTQKSAAGENEKPKKKTPAKREHPLPQDPHLTAEEIAAWLALFDQKDDKK